MTTVYSPTEKKTRLEQALALEELQKNRTQQDVADEINVPRSTLATWLQRDKKLKRGTNATIACFLESSAGIIFLHRLITTMLLVFHNSGNCGLPCIQVFLRLNHFDKFLGISIGSLSKAAQKMDELLVQFGSAEKNRMAAGMTHKDITGALDENFIMELMTLILMEPVSGFILSEGIEEKRDAETWQKVTEAATKNLNITIHQMTGDAGSGLTKYTVKVLGAHKSPDLFHIQQDITRGLTSVLARKLKQAEKDLEEARAQKKLGMEKMALLAKEPGMSITTPQVIKCGQFLCNADKEEKKNEKILEESQSDYKKAQTARRKITESYHPFDLETGKERVPEELEITLKESHKTLKELSEKVDCSEKQKKTLKKAEDMYGSMKQTLAFFWKCILIIMLRLNLSDEESIFFKKLISLFYLKLVYERSEKKKDKEKIQKTIDRIKKEIDATELWRSLDPGKKEQWKKQSQECAHIFQRSSSAVEGRNGTLSLKFHTFHRLSKLRMEALTVLHNFFSTRKDNTTAAERFFEQKQRDLVDWLLNHFDFSLRPRSRRKKSPEKERISQAA